MLNLSSQDKKFLAVLGARVRKLREERGWTLEETEEHGWASWRHLQRIETGKKNMTIITLRKICKVFEISLFELFLDFDMK